MTVTHESLTDYTIRVRRFDPTDPRLGRHVRHDSRSLLYKAPEADPASLASIQHQSHIPVLDQGQVGSCTGNASTKALSYGVLWAAAAAVLSQTDEPVDEQYAVGVYSDATQLDDYPGYYKPGDPNSQDTGSDGLSVAKVLQRRGLIAGYQHATTLNAVLAGLAQQAVITGTTWHDDMFNPSSAGEIKPTGNVAGGHEYVLDQLDVEQQRVWIQNSWNTSWGLGGRAWMSWDAYATLLADSGDATIFTPANQPAPTPTPPAPQPTPPQPAPPGPVNPTPPTPTPPASPVEELITVGDQWMVRRRLGMNRVMQNAYAAWRAAGSPGLPPQG